MIRRALVPLAAVVALGAASPEGAPSLADRLRWNARERTATGVAELRHHRPESAADAFDAALRARPDDPLVSFNAGTGRLAAGRADAVPELERAARAAPDGLAADAWFNLGNARLAAKDAAGAVEAFEESLRRRPEDAGAKRNLELALRALREQEANRRADQTKPGERQSAKPDSEASSDRTAGSDDASAGSDQAQDAGQQPRPDDDAAGERRAGAEADPRADDGRADSGEPGKPSPDAEGESPLPRFHDVPELDAEQAAALLQAVENLERDERRRRARERALAAGEADEDW